ncbi:MAG: universal stress protein UspA [Ponticaulis sp.]|nr:universal stress protein UspA [Ponticaulis sp.]
MAFYTALAEGEFSLKETITLSCRLAKQTGKPLIGVTAMPDPARAVMMTGASMHGMMIAAGGQLAQGIREAQNEAKETLEAEFKTVCAAEGLSPDAYSIEHHVGLPTEIYPRVSLLSDGLIVAHECISAGNDHGMAFESTLLDRRQPVIVSGTDGAPGLDTMIIAWDGSPQASRAVRFHYPVLKAAKNIVIAQNSKKVDPDDRFGADNPQRVADFLAPLGIPTEIVHFDGAVAKGLLTLAEERNAGMIVAGAYGHSKLEEMVFGGVSRNLLRAENGPALALSH